MKSKNKLVPRLLGITKESVMRVDERTKDVVQEWPLTTVKRWAASPKSFTLVRRAFTGKHHNCITRIHHRSAGKNSPFLTSLASSFHSVCVDNAVDNSTGCNGLAVNPTLLLQWP